MEQISDQTHFSVEIKAPPFPHPARILRQPWLQKPIRKRKRSEADPCVTENLWWASVQPRRCPEAVVHPRWLWELISSSRPDLWHLFKTYCVTSTVLTEINAEGQVKGHVSLNSSIKWIHWVQENKLRTTASSMSRSTKRGIECEVPWARWRSANQLFSHLLMLHYMKL